MRYEKDVFVYSGGIYSLEIPKPLVEMNEKNEGFVQKIDQGVALFFDYTFDHNIEGLTVGTDITTQAQTVSFNGSEASFNTFVMLARVGYHYVPLNNNLYLFPWAGVGYTEITSGSPEITSENKKFDYENFTTFVTLHIGYRL